MGVLTTNFGKDHWSLFAYVETVVVDRKGIIENARLRTSHERHPLFIDMHRNAIDGARYPTRCKDGELSEHDDWDCLVDLKNEGLIRILSPRNQELWQVEAGRRGPIQPAQRPFVKVRVALTKRGWDVVAKLREHIATTHRAHDFEVAS